MGCAGWSRFLPVRLRGVAPRPAALKALERDVSERSQRAVHREFFKCKSWPKVGEPSESRTQLKQPGFGALVGGKGIEFVAADSAE